MTRAEPRSPSPSISRFLFLRFGRVGRQSGLAAGQRLGSVVARFCLLFLGAVVGGRFAWGFLFCAGARGRFWWGDDLIFHIFNRSLRSRRNGGGLFRWRCARRCCGFFGRPEKHPVQPNGQRDGKCREQRERLRPPAFAGLLDVRLHMLPHAVGGRVPARFGGRFGEVFKSFAKKIVQGALCLLLSHG